MSVLRIAIQYVIFFWGKEVKTGVLKQLTPETTCEIKWYNPLTGE